MSQDRFVVVFPLYPGVTHLDFAGPHEVLARLPNTSLILASHGGGTVEAVSGMVTAEVQTLGEVENCDMICVPGGPGVDAALGDEVFLGQVRRLAVQARYVTSVCSGALLLGAVGMLIDKRATSHWNSIDLLPLFGAIPTPGRVVRDGDLFTCGGVTAGIDLALTVAAEIASPELAQGIQLAMEYAPAPPFEAGRPDLAPPEVAESVRATMARGAYFRRQAAERAAERMNEFRRVVAATGR